MPTDFIKTLIKLFYRKDDKSECGNYRNISLATVRSKLRSKMILFRRKDDVDKFLREEQCSLGSVVLV